MRKLLTYFSFILGAIGIWGLITFIPDRMPCSQPAAAPIEGEVFTDIPSEDDLKLIGPKDKRWWEYLDLNIPKQVSNKIKEFRKKYPKINNDANFTNPQRSQELNQIRRDFMIEFVEQNLKNLEKEAKKNPKIKSAAQKMEQTVNPQVEAELSENFKLKTKADLLRGHGLVKVTGPLINGEAHMFFNRHEKMEVRLYRDFDLGYFPLNSSVSFRENRDDARFWSKFESPISNKLRIGFESSLSGRSEQNVQFLYRTDF